MTIKIESDMAPPYPCERITLPDETIVTPNLRNIVSVEFVSENVLSDVPAHVRVVLSNGKTECIRAVVSRELGADGGRYPTIRFESAR